MCNHVIKFNDTLTKKSFVCLPLLSNGIICDILKIGMISVLYYHEILIRKDITIKKWNVIIQIKYR